ncbi:MAG TPA: alpha/beta hydrolase [Steroidobacteraceae bacterium]|jgi:pimeloyl-ACP methyl ester carboxylesterase
MTLRFHLLAILAAALTVPCSPARAAAIRYGWQKVDGLEIFYREGGAPAAPTIVLLHGNPASSIQYEKLMERIASPTLHVIAMDYPSFGYSSAPGARQYAYTFDHVAETVSHFLAARGIERYALFMQDYGVPVGFRLIAADPGAITAVMVQNGVIHLDGFPLAQDPNGELRRHWRHRNAAIDQRRITYIRSLEFPQPQQWDEDDKLSPDTVLLMMASEQRPGVPIARADLWFDYGSNVKRYPEWQAMLKRLQPPTLVIWGSRDDFFTVPGAVAYLKEVPRAEVHILDTVHFATLEEPGEVARIILDFVARHPLAAPGAHQARMLPAH